MVVIAHPLTPSLVRRGSGGFCNPLIDFQLLFRGFNSSCRLAQGKSLFVPVLRQAMTRVVMMKGRTRMAWRRLVSPWGEGEKESLVSHPKTIMKDARSQSSRTHAPQARRHAARPPSTAQAGRQGEMVLLCTTTVVGGGGRPNAVCSSVLVCVKGRLLSVKLQGRKTKDKTEIDRYRENWKSI